MKNYQLHNYRSKPVCDSHVHLHEELPLDETIKILNNVMNYMNYEKIALEALPSYGITDNYKALYLKSKINGVYANLGLVHNFDERDTQEFYLEQAKLCHAMGCDGFKMLEGKPDYRKKLSKPLNDKSFDKFYGYAEENQLPIVLHFGDPRSFWDPEKIPEWALKRGWLYDESFVSFEDMQKEVEGILEKFPKLNLVIAHFFFISDDINYAEWLMNKWDNVCLDITSGSEMYFNFDKNSAAWREFFIKYADRIIYGTDIYNWQQKDMTMEQRYAHAVNLQRSFLEKKEPFFDNWRQNEFKNPFGFDDVVLDKIYNNNFLRLFGEKPKEVNCGLIVSECQKLKRVYKLDELEMANINQIVKDLSK